MIRPGTLAETTVSSSPYSVPTTSTDRWTGSVLAGERTTGTVVAARAAPAAACVLRSQAVRDVTAAAATAVESTVMSRRLRMACWLYRRVRHYPRKATGSRPRDDAGDSTR